MKICFILGDKLPLGGIQKHALSLLDKLASNYELDCHVILDPKLSSIVPSSVKAHYLALGNGRRNPFVYLKLLGLILKIRPTILHSHTKKYYRFLCFFKKLIPSKLVFTIHSLYNPKFFKNFKMDMYIAVSKQLSKLFENSEVIYNGIEIEHKDYKVVLNDISPPFLYEGKPILLACGRFVNAKGFDLLIKAIKDIPDIRLWLIGDGPERFLLKNLIHKYHLSDRVWLTGSLEQDAVYGLMSSADLFVISSRNEGGPITLLEALNFNCPLISTRVGFARELLREEQLFASADVDSMRCKLKGVINNLANYKKGFEKQFVEAKTRFSLDIMAEKTKFVYESLLDNKEAS